MRKLFFSLSLIMTITFFSLTSYALIDPWSFPNYVQNFNNQINTLITAQRELISIQNQAKNLDKVSDYQWQDTTELMQQMSESMRQGQALSMKMSNKDRQFRQRYPDYTRSNVGKENYTSVYQRWNDTTLDTLRGSLSAASIDASNINNEQAVLARLKHQGDSATGRMQVLQVSTEIAGENVDQLLQLKGLMMAQMNAQNAYMAYRISRDSYNEEGLAALASNAGTQFPSYHDNMHFGLISLK